MNVTTGACATRDIDSNAESHALKIGHINESIRENKCERARASRKRERESERWAKELGMENLVCTQCIYVHVG